MAADQKRSDRLDQALVLRGLAPTRSRARDLVLRGHVSLDGLTVLKPSMTIAPSATLSVTDEAADVSRGAVKLRAALHAFGLDATDRVCLDVGASTGGFTQALLSAGAAKVYAVDVGHGQLSPALRDEPRIVNLEATDSRALTPEHFTIRPQAVVADVSFISLRKALPVPLALADSGAWLAALIKPQFEVGRDAIGKGGIVRDEAARRDAVAAVSSWLEQEAGWRVIGTIASPIEGGSGNQEYLIGCVNDA